MYEQTFALARPADTNPATPDGQIVPLPRCVGRQSLAVFSGRTERPVFGCLSCLLLPRSRRTASHGGSQSQATHPNRPPGAELRFPADKLSLSPDRAVAASTPARVTYTRGPLWANGATPQLVSDLT